MGKISVSIGVRSIPQMASTTKTGAHGVTTIFDNLDDAWATHGAALRDQKKVMKIVSCWAIKSELAYECYTRCMTVKFSDESPPAKEPVSEKPGVSEPSSEKPVSEEPSSEKPVSEEPSSEKPVSEEPPPDD